MSKSLTNEERKLRASIAAHTAHARHGTRKMTAAMREAANFTRFADQLDPNRELEGDELARRVEHARIAHMKALSFKAAKARRLKAAAAEGSVAQ